MSDDLPMGEWLPGWLITPKCECGTTITLGKDDIGMLHSSYCPVRTRWEEDNAYEQSKEKLKQGR